MGKELRYDPVTKAHYEVFVPDDLNVYHAAFTGVVVTGEAIVVARDFAECERLVWAEMDRRGFPKAPDLSLKFTLIPNDRPGIHHFYDGDL